MKHRTIKQRIQRFFQSSIWLNIQIFAFAIIFILLSPVILSILPILIYLDNRQKLKIANRFHCITCGQILGQPALELADQEWSKLMSLLNSENTKLKIQRQARTVHAICINCKTRFTYSEQAKIFTRAIQ